MRLYIEVISKFKKCSHTTHETLIKDVKVVHNKNVGINRIKRSGTNTADVQQEAIKTMKSNNIAPVGNDLLNLSAQLMQNQQVHLIFRLTVYVSVQHIITL